MHYEIRQLHTGRVLYHGDLTGRETVEAAIAEGAELAGADLRGLNLMNANLDGGRLRGAHFGGANLTGANLAEAELDGADFSDAALYNACLCFSSLAGARFIDAAFGATDIAGAKLDCAVFSTVSAFTLNFSDAASLQDCLYTPAGDGATSTRCAFSLPPLVLTGLGQNVIVMEDHIYVGSRLMTHQDYLQQTSLRNDMPAAARRAIAALLNVRAADAGFRLTG